MSEYMHLIGSEDVVRASNNMREAADTMTRAANSMQETCEQLSRLWVEIEQTLRSIAEASKGGAA